MDYTVKQWNLESNSCIRTFRHSSYVFCLAATVDANWLLSGDRSGSVLLWDTTTGQQLASVKAHSDTVSCLKVTPDGRSFVSGSWDHSLKLWRFEALQQPVIEFSGHSHRVNACAVSSDGSRIFSGSNDMSIRVWNSTTGQLLASIQSHSSGVTSLALSGSLLLSGSYDFNLKLWDVGSMQLLHTLRHSDFVHSVAASSDGSLVLSGGGSKYGGNEYSVCVWDAVSGAQLAAMQEHSDEVHCITLSSDGRLAASASTDGTICVWDLFSHCLCAKLKGNTALLA